MDNNVNKLTMKIIETLCEFKAFRICWIFGSLTTEMKTELVKFWLTNGAIINPDEAWRRTMEVGCIAYNANDEIVGVSSIYKDSLQPQGSVYWFYRTFIRPDSRVLGLNSRIFDTTFKQLLFMNAGFSDAPYGVIVVTENAKLESRGASLRFQRMGFERLGNDQRGMSVWRKSFHPIIA